MYEVLGRIKYSEVGKDGKLTLHHLINYFQDCSTFHLEDIQLGIDYSRKENQAFFLVSWQIEINRLPELGERVRIGTLIHEGKGIYGYRNYVMYDEKNQLLAYANATVCFVDLTTGKFAKLSAEERAKYPTEEKLDMDYLPRKIKTPPLEKTHSEVAIQECHIDMNHHVNNSQYAAIAMNYIPSHQNASRVRIEYKHAAKHGDTLIPMTAEQDGNYFIALCDKDHKPYVVLEFSNKDS